MKRPANRAPTHTPKRTLAALLSALFVVAVAVPVGALAPQTALAPATVNAPGGEEEPFAMPPTGESDDAGEGESAPSAGEPETPVGPGVTEPSENDGPAGGEEPGESGDPAEEPADGSTNPAGEAGDNPGEGPAAGEENTENTPENSDAAPGEAAEETDPTDPDSTGETDGDGDDPAGLDDPLFDPALLDIEGLDLDRAPVDIRTLLGILDPPLSSILSGFYLSFEEDGVPTDTPTVNASAEAHFKMFLPDDLCDSMVSGDYYDIEIDALRFTASMRFDLVYDGAVIATLSVLDAHTVRLTFTDNVREYNEIELALEFWGALDADSLEVGTNYVYVPTEKDIPPYEVTIRPATGSPIDKRASLDRLANPQYITWEVDVNKSLESLTNVVIFDDMPPGLTIEDIKVEAAMVNTAGEIIDPLTELAAGSDYTLATDANGRPTITMASLGTALRITYTTKIDDDGAVNTTLEYENTVTFDADGYKTQTARAPAFATFGIALGKEATAYDSASQTVTWAIYYNYNERILNPAWLQDTFKSDELNFVDGSVKIYPVAFDEKSGEGIPDKSAPIDENTYVVTPNPGGDGLRIDFKNEVTDAYYVEFKTTVDAFVDDSFTVTNFVEDQNGNTAENGYKAGQGGLVKTLKDIDQSKKTASWQVVINRPGYLMRNYTLTDTFGPGLTWLEGEGYPFTVTLFDPAKGDTGVVVDASNYTLHVAEDGKSFTLTFINGYESFTDCLAVNLHTSYNPLLVTDGYLRNTARGKWWGEDGKEHNNSAGAERFINRRDIYNGAKGGSYNYQTREITWTIEAGYSAVGMKNAYIEDEIQQNQNYIDGSLTIGRFDIAKDGTVNPGSVLTAEELAAFTILAPNENGGVLRVDFPNDAEEPGMYWIEFKTSLAGELIDPEYKNTAYFYNDSYETRPLTAEINVTNGGALATKTGEIDEATNTVWWNITVNPTRSTLYNAVVYDEPSENQLIDFERLAVYGANIDDKGNVTRDGATVLDPGEYTATYAPNETGAWVLTVEFAEVITEAYIIRYPVTVITEKNLGTEELTNKVTIKSYNREEVEEVIGDSVQVDVAGGGGVVTGRRSGFTLQKLCGESGDALEGATFTLYNAEGRQLGTPFTTDENGEITVGSLVYGTYTVYETVAPVGYSVLPRLAEGYEVTVNADSEQAANTVVLYNNPTAVTLEKQNENGDALAGAVFKLERWDETNQAYVPIRAGETHVTGEDGLLTITGLAVGGYRLIETTAPEGYLLDATPIEFTLEADETGNIEPVHLGPVVNLPNSAQVIKEDPANDARLAGCEFMLEVWVPAGAEAGEEDAATIYHPVKERTTLIQPVAVEPGGEWVRLYEDETFITGEDGLVILYGLAPGTYRFTEIVSPEGYTIDSTPLEFTIETTTAEAVSVGVHYNTRIEEVTPPPTPQDPETDPPAGALEPGSGAQPGRQGTITGRKGTITGATGNASAPGGTANSATAANGGSARRAGAQSGAARGTGIGAATNNVAQSADGNAQRALALGLAAILSATVLALTAAAKRRRENQ